MLVASACVRQALLHHSNYEPHNEVGAHSEKLIVNYELHTRFIVHYEVEQNYYELHCWDLGDFARMAACAMKLIVHYEALIVAFARDT